MATINKYLTVKTIALALLCIICMGAITSFSCQSASSSDDLSRGVTDKVLSVSPKYRKSTEEQKSQKVDEANTKVRNAAHFCSFLALGFFAYLFLSSIKLKFAVPIAVAWCAIYALFDETLQKLLDNGRAFEISDLLKDCSGAALGIAIAFGAAFLIRKKLFTK